MYELERQIFSDGKRKISSAGVYRESGNVDACKITHAIVLLENCGPYLKPPYIKNCKINCMN